MTNLKDIVASYLDKIVAYRRDIHAHPELGYDELRTSGLIADTLESIGIPTQRGVGKTGVVGIIEGGKPGKVIALRADIDALPITETTGLEYASVNKGVSHSCGHDMHTAMLLGAAHVLWEIKDQLTGTVKLVFQPAEESNPTGGAPGMIADGVLENPKVDAMVALHVWPQYETGTAAIKQGPMMAASDRIFIDIKGRSSHGSAPEDGVDAIVMASAVVGALQTIVSRNVGPLDSAVVTIGKISGGDRYNVICSDVSLEGTVRNLNPTVRNAMPQRIERVVSGVTSAMGGSYEFRYVNGYPPVVNDKAMADMVLGSMQKVLGAGAMVPERSALGGEDFSFFCEHLPCAYFWLGCRKPGVPFEQISPIHNGGFCPDEAALPIGVEIMVQSVLDFLGC